MAKKNTLLPSKGKHWSHKPWPSHIPTHCPKCGEKMNRKVNLFTSPSQTSILTKKLAPWLSLIILALAIVLLAILPGRSVHGLGQGSPMALVAIIVGPPILLTICANFMQKFYKLQCHHCKNSADYTLKDQS